MAPHQDLADGTARERHDELVDVDERGPGDVLRVIYPEVIVGGKLPRPLRPANYRNVPGKAGGANQVGATVCAAIVIKNEQIDTDHAMERQPLQQVGRLVLEDRADGDLVHPSRSVWHVQNRSHA